MSNLRIVFDKEASGYRVEHRADADGPAIATTEPFLSHGEAQSYLQACESGARKFNPNAGGDDPRAPAATVATINGNRTMTGTKRTSAGLRNVLFDEIDLLRKGEGDIKRAMAISHLAKQILATAELEHKFDKNRVDDYVPPPLQLGDAPEAKMIEPSQIAPPSRDRLTGGR